MNGLLNNGWSGLVIATIVIVIAVGVGYLIGQMHLLGSVRSMGLRRFSVALVEAEKVHAEMLERQLAIVKRSAELDVRESQLDDRANHLNDEASVIIEKMIRTTEIDPELAATVVIWNNADAYVSAMVKEQDKLLDERDRLGTNIFELRRAIAVSSWDVKLSNPDRMIVGNSINGGYGTVLTEILKRFKEISSELLPATREELGSAEAKLQEAATSLQQQKNNSTR